MRKLPFRNFLILSGEGGIRPTQSKSRYLIKKRRTISPSNKLHSYRLNPAISEQCHTQQEKQGDHRSTVVLFLGWRELAHRPPKTKQVTDNSVTCFSIQRRGRDSNPRNSCPFTAFRVRPDRPLRHLSLKATTHLSGCKYSNFFYFVLPKRYFLSFFVALTVTAI